MSGETSDSFHREGGPLFPHREMPALWKTLRLRLDYELADHLGGRAVERLH